MSPKPPSAEMEELCRVLLDRHGMSFAREAGIRLDSGTPAPLFQLLCLSLLISARISSRIAVAAWVALRHAGWTTPQKMAGASWENKVKVLNRSGYARYDESTARYLDETTTRLIEEFGGDLRRVRHAANGDPPELRRQIESFKGIGEVGSAVFLREVQAVWSEFVPFVDERTLATAKALGLPSTGAELRELVSDDDEFVRLVAAVVRARIAHEDADDYRIQD